MNSALVLYKLINKLNLGNNFVMKQFLKVKLLLMAKLHSLLKYIYHNSCMFNNRYRQRFITTNKYNENIMLCCC